MTIEIKTFIPSITWREIPKARRERIREFLKRLATEIRAGKTASRQLQSANDRKLELPDAIELGAASARASYAYDLFRHLHTLCSIARGKTLEQIENPKTRKSTTPELKDWMLSYCDQILTGETRLYIVMNPALTSGQKMAQAIHAAIAFHDLQTPWSNETVIVKDATIDPPYMNHRSQLPGYNLWQAWLQAAQDPAKGEYAHFIDSDLPEELKPAAFALWGPYASSLLGILPLSN